MKRTATTLITGTLGILVWGILLMIAASQLRQGAGNPDSADPIAAIVATDGDSQAEMLAATMPTADAAVEDQTPAATPTVGGSDNSAPVKTDDQTKAVRPVEPESFEFPVARDATGLERIDPRPALGESDLKPKPAAAITLPRPSTVMSGVMAFGPRNLQLAGLVPVEATRKCKSAAGKDWPCGMAARTAQRMFLRNRAVSCDLASNSWKGTVTTGCTLGEQDISAWLVENGWAEPSPESAYAALGEAARSARKGIFGDDPRSKPKAAVDTVP